MQKSIWTLDMNLPKFDSLKGHKKIDVLIIGGGLCGVLCAYFLEKRGVDYILVEAKRIASGITQNTTAKITSLHGLIYDDLVKKLGTEYAKMYLEANQKALENYKKQGVEIDCDFEIKPAYTYSLTDRQKIENEVEAVNSLGFSAKFENPRELPLETQGAICFEEQAQFNPLKFIGEISKNLNIYEKTFVRKVTPTGVEVDGGSVSCKKIIVCTHFPFINRHGSYFLKLYQHRSYVSAFENPSMIKGMYVDESLDGLSFSSHKNFLLIGGGSHRTGKKGGAWDDVSKYQKQYYPKAVLKYKWATQDCMSLDSIPYIGRYSAKTQNLFVATGFNKWGMTSSMAAAEILADMIEEKENDYAKVFSPQRSILKPQLFVNGFESTKNLLTPVKKRCPHLGCALKWNKYEHSWDCPCHGSRFTEQGKLIDNPATGDADIK